MNKEQMGELTDIVIAVSVLHDHLERITEILCQCDEKLITVKGE